MKKLIFSGLIVLLTIGTYAQGKKSPIEGTWNLVSWKSITGGIVVGEFPATFSGSDLVIYSESHFLSIGRLKFDTSFHDNYVGAKYTLTGNHSEETILYFPNQDQVGSKVKSLLELRNDSLIKTYPVNDNWEIDKSNYNVEKYVRVK